MVFSMFKIPVYAHRGASAYAFENTLKAFEKAVELGADGIELDIQLTRDGVPIIYHDLNLRRLTGSRKRVNDLTYEQVMKKKIGKPFRRIFRGEKIMSLREMINWATENRVALNIELKESLMKEPLFVKEIVRRCKGLPDVHFSSFHYELLEIIKSQFPKVETAYILTKNSDWGNLKKYKAADLFHLHKRNYKEDKLGLLQNSGKKVRFYGVVGSEPFITNPHPIVRGWITDYPEVVLNAQEQALMRSQI